MGRPETIQATTGLALHSRCWPLALCHCLYLRQVWACDRPQGPEDGEWGCSAGELPQRAMLTETLAHDVTLPVDSVETLSPRRGSECCLWDPALGAWQGRLRVPRDVTHPGHGGVARSRDLR